MGSGFVWGWWWCLGGRQEGGVPRHLQAHYGMVPASPGHCGYHMTSHLSLPSQLPTRPHSFTGALTTQPLLQLALCAGGWAVLRRWPRLSFCISFHALRHVTSCEGGSAAGEGTCKQRTAVFVRGWEGEPEPPCDHADRAVRDDGSQY